MNRRKFLASSGVAAVGAFIPSISRLALASSPVEPFQWRTDDLVFRFDVTAGKLRQKRLVPASLPAAAEDSSGVEVALQCSGENSPDQGMKSGMGQPGARLLFAGKREESTPTGKRLVCMHTDAALDLRVESFYESFDGVPVVRRHTKVTNAGTSPLGIEFVSSAMLHGLAAPQDFDRELRIHTRCEQLDGRGAVASTASVGDGLRGERAHQLVRSAGRQHRQLVHRNDICRWRWWKTPGWA